MIAERPREASESSRPSSTTDDSSVRVPGFLRDVDTSRPAPEPPLPPRPSATEPSWLDRVMGKGRLSAPSKRGPPGNSAEPEPTFIRQALDDLAAPPESTKTAEESVKVPGWLGETQEGGAPRSSQVETAVAENSIAEPSWLERALFGRLSKADKQLSPMVEVDEPSFIKRAIRDIFAVPRSEESLKREQLQRLFGRMEKMAAKESEVLVGQNQLEKKRDKQKEFWRGVFKPLKLDKVFFEEDSVGCCAQRPKNGTTAPPFHK